MDAPTQQFQWSALAEPYNQALRQAVEYILSRFEPVGMIAAGSILRGAPDATSDLDIYVIHHAPFRQRIQKLFNGIPAEIFVNPPAAIVKYFASEQAAGRPLTAHMLATGYVILATDPVVNALCEQARTLLMQAPPFTDAQCTVARYMAATGYEDATDVVQRDPATAGMLLSQAVTSMLQYAFQARHRFLPRNKELLDQLAQMDPELAQASRSFFQADSLDQRLGLAEQIADLTIRARGFFEWESAPDPVETPH